VDSQHQLLQTIDPKLCAKPDESVNGYQWSLTSHVQS
jgi:hypothetical protein